MGDVASWPEFPRGALRQTAQGETCPSQEAAESGLPLTLALRRVRRMAPCSCGIMRRAPAGDEKRPEGRDLGPPSSPAPGQARRLGRARGRWRCREPRRFAEPRGPLGEEARDRSRFGGVDGRRFRRRSRRRRGAKFSILRAADQSLRPAAANPARHRRADARIPAPTMRGNAIGNIGHDHLPPEMLRDALFARARFRRICTDVKSGPTISRPAGNAILSHWLH